MAKWRCVCGELIHASGLIPNPIEWRMMSDVELDEFHGQVDIEQVYLRMTMAFRCPASDHLYIFWDGFDHPPALYQPIESNVLD